MKTSEIDELQDLEHKRWRLASQIIYMDRAPANVILRLDGDTLPIDIAEVVAPQIKAMLKADLVRTEHKIRDLGVEIDTDVSDHL